MILTEKKYFDVSELKYLFSFCSVHCGHFFLRSVINVKLRKIFKNKTFSAPTFPCKFAMLVLVTHVDPRACILSSKKAINILVLFLISHERGSYAVNTRTNAHACHHACRLEQPVLLNCLR